MSAIIPFCTSGCSTLTRPVFVFDDPLLVVSAGALGASAWLLFPPSALSLAPRKRSPDLTPKRALPTAQLSHLLRPSTSSAPFAARRRAMRACASCACSSTRVRTEASYLGFASSRPVLLASSAGVTLRYGQTGAHHLLDRTQAYLSPQAFTSSPPLPFPARRRPRVFAHAVQVAVSLGASSSGRAIVHAFKPPLLRLLFDMLTPPFFSLTHAALPLTCRWPSCLCSSRSSSASRLTAA